MNRTEETQVGADSTYWQERTARIVADPDMAKDYAESLRKRLKEAREHLEKLAEDPRRRESVELTEAQIRADQLEYELQAIEDAEWTLEVTRERRQAWNAAVKDPRYCAGGVVFASSIERDLGFTLEALKRQVQRWGL